MSYVPGDIIDARLGSSFVFNATFMVINDTLPGRKQVGLVIAVTNKGCNNEAFYAIWSNGAFGWQHQLHATLAMSGPA